MYYYFSGEYPAAIKINGIYYGILNGTVKHLRVDGDAPFVEICPLVDGESGVNFLLDQNFLSHPPPSVTVTDMRGGYMVKFYPVCAKSEFKIITQAKSDDAVITVFTENGLKLSIETRNDFYAETFYFSATDADITRFALNNVNFAAVRFTSNKNTLCVYRLTDGIKKVFCRDVDEFSCDGSFTTVENYADMAKHKVTAEWEFNGSEFKQTHADVSRDQNFTHQNLNEKLIPYAFLEALRIGADISNYITDGMKVNLNHLKDFLGEFIGVMPPPRFRQIEQVGLIYACSANVYRVDYFIFELEDERICNVKKCEE